MNEAAPAKPREMNLRLTVLSSIRKQEAPVVKSGTYLGDTSIVERSTTGSDFFERLLDSKCWAVGSVRVHRVDRIGDCEDLCVEQNLLPNQVIRVSGSVKPFMMLENDLGNRPGEFDLLQDLIAGLHV